ELGAGAVLRRPLDVVGIAARPGDLRDHHLVDLVRLLLQLVLHVHRRGGEKSMDAPALGRLDRLRAAVDVLNAARASPQTTEFLVRWAISCTAAKSPSEAIGKPASMMSTPIWSSTSATSSFSSWVMVAPGHCSPSRNLVSKMTTRSFSDGVDGLDIGL